MEPTAEALPEIAPVILATFGDYLARRLAFYQDAPGILGNLLKKDVLLLAMRGLSTSDEFVEHAFTAFESSSEETMWGNAWQQAIARAAPGTVGGGDLRTERGDTLWIIQLKLGKQNSGAHAQDVRVLQSKVRQETDHHPGRRNVKAMYAIIRGQPRKEWRHYKDNSPANKDIQGFQYQYMEGTAFLEWISADFAPALLVERLRVQSEQIRAAREGALEAVKERLRAELASAGYAADILGVMSLADDRGKHKRRRWTNLSG